MTNKETETRMNRGCDAIIPTNIRVSKGHPTREEIDGVLTCVAVASQLTTLKQCGKNLVGLCPLHNERSPSFYVNPITDKYKCFGCGSGGDKYDLIRAHHNAKSFPEVLQIATTYIRGQTDFVSTWTQVPKYSETKIKVKRYEVISDNTGLWYWELHGVNAELLIEMGMYFIREIGITTEEGTRVKNSGNDFPAFGYQSGGAYKVYIPLADKSFKHQWTDRTDTREHWFPSVKTLNKSASRIIITAGQKDCIVLTSRGYCAVSSTGSESSRISDAAIAELRNITNDICICYDTDTTGKKFARQHAEAHGLTIIHLPEIAGTKDISDFAWNGLFPHGKTLEQIGARFETVSKK